MLVVLADHLTLSDVTRPDLPNLTRLQREGQMALMSPGLPQKLDPVANLYATLGAGDSIRVGDISEGRLGETLRQAGIRTALLGDADGDDTGLDRPASFLLPAPDQFVAGAGTVADSTAPGGRRIDAVRLWAQTQAALRDCDLVVVHFGDFARFERENRQGDLLPAAYAAHRERALQRLDQYLGLALGRGPFRPLFLVTTPSLDAHGGWHSLAPILLSSSVCGPDRMAILPHGTVARSDTTQTVGLVAARDLAPTILNTLRVVAPRQMTGAPIEAVRVAGANLERLDRLTRLNQEAQLPLFWSLGLGGAAIVFAGLALYLTGRMTGRIRPIALYGLGLLSAWPLALLLAPLLNPHTVAIYLIGIAALTFAIALVPSPSFIFAATAVVIVLDGLTGTALVSQSVLSAYALAGIRFYGIGNEYMGVLLGGALLALTFKTLTPPQTATLSPGRARVKTMRRVSGSLARFGERAGVRVLCGRWGNLAVFLWFALVTFTLSFPAFGAKAGGAITATATFTLAWLRLRGIPLRARHFILSLAAGFALVLVWAVLGHWLGVRRTHLETSVGALGEGRFGYIVGVAARKLGLALRVALHPGTLLGLLAFALVGALGRFLLWRQVSNYLSMRASLKAVCEAGLWGSLVCLLFNDSGIVAAILLLACLLLTLLHGLYKDAPCDSSV